jgi:ATP-dependent Clp protease ATP-binding subunit ClpA
VDNSAGTSTVGSALEKIFSPEFRNRLDKIVTFKRLEHEQILSIVDKEIAEFARQLRRKRVSLVVTDDVRQWFAYSGFSSEFGARNISRLVQDRLKDYFVDNILFGDLKGGGEVRVELKRRKGEDKPVTAEEIKKSPEDFELSFEDSVLQS